MPVGILSVIIIGAIAAYFFINTSALASVKDTIVEAIPSPTLDSIFQKYGTEFGVDWKLAKAHAIVESSLDPSAVNETDNESLGLMQILCRPDGKGGCINRLYVDGWKDATREKLLDPDFNVYIGVQIIASNVKAYGLPKAIAVYNEWDQHTADVPQAGPFANQEYVDRVMKAYNSL